MASSPAIHRPISRHPWPQRGASYFHLHLVSDATGETLITVARAAAAQYASVSPVEHVHPLVRIDKQLDRVLDEIEEAPGIVLYTLLEQDLAERLEENAANSACRVCRSSVRCCGLFQSYLGGETKPRVGAQHVLNAEYFKRIDALNYTMLHDDGQHATIWSRPTWCWSACRARRRRRPRSISPTAASRPPISRWCRACRCRRSSKR